MALFVGRARAADPGFSLTPYNAPGVAELCVRLDGLPLAIELAAGRIALLSPVVMLPRLEGAPMAGQTPLLGVLRRGPRDLPPRQQTLEAAISWSYGLLGPAEQALFRRLAVFAGGCTLEAVEAVCAFDAGDGTFRHDEVADLLSELIDKSLVLRDEQRYRLLETIRQYAADKVEEVGETSVIRARHRDWFLEFAERGYAHMRPGGAPEWTSRLDADHDNCRAALAWSEERSDERAFARLAAALWWYWQLRGLASEAQPYLERALEAGDVPPAVRASVLNGAAMFAYDRGDYGRAAALAEEALGLCRQESDAWGQALALCSLGFVAYFQADYDGSRRLLEESLALARQSGDRPTMGRALNNLGLLELAQGELEPARGLFEDSLAVWRELGSGGATALALMFLGRIAHELGDQPRAAGLLDDSAAMARRTGYPRALGPALYLLGRVMRAQGADQRATELYRESLAIRREQGDRRGIAECLEGLAVTAAADRPDVATRLVGSAQALRAAIGAPPAPRARSEQEQLLGGLRERLGSRLDDLRAEGAALPLDGAVQYALETVDPGVAAPGPGTVDTGLAESLAPGILSPREREVAGLVARGLSNREIAAELVVIEGSAANYVQRILTKLGFRSRAQIAVWAAEHGLASRP